MAEKVVVELEVKSDKGVKGVQKLNKEISNTNKEIKETQDASSQMGSTLDKATGGAVTKFKNLRGALKTAVTGFKSLRVAVIGTGIGALLIAVTSLGQAFTRSEEGQNKFAKILGIIGSVTGNLLDLLADLGEGIISVFENPKQALIDFKNAIVENVQNRITSLIDTFGFLGSAIKKVFSGDFTGALEDAKKSGSSLVDSFTGVKNSIDKATESTKGFIEELKEEAKIAGQIADQRAKADKVERKLIVERAKANRDRAELLDKAAQKENFTAQERIAFLEEAARIDEEITNKEIEAARLRLEAKQAENALTKSTKADLDEEANLKARLIDLETQRLTKQKTVSAQIVSAKREEQARLKAIDTEEKERIKKEEEETALKQKEKQDKEIADAKALSDLKNQIRNAEAVTEEERRLLEIEKTTEHYNKLIELARAQGLTTVALEEAKTKALGKLNQTTSKNEIEWEKLTQKEKSQIITQGLNNLTSILGEESAAGKAAAIASATISTYQSATDSYKSLSGIPIIGPALGFAAAGAAIASGVANVKKIASTKTPKGKGSGGSPSISGGGGSAPSVSQPPAFNVVGASDTNQLADAIGGQSQKPVKAFVVSNDVTTAQSMDRNIVDGASI
jgi:hypothetical protein